MNYVETFLNVVAGALESALVYLVQAFFLVIALVIAYIVAWIAMKLVRKTWKGLGIDKKLEELKVQDAFIGIKPVDIVAFLIGFYVFLLIVYIAVGPLSMPTLQLWLTGLLAYYAQFVQAVIFLAAVMLVADIISDRIRERQDIQFNDVLAAGIQGFLILLGVLVVLPAIFPSTNVAFVSTIVLLLTAGIALGIGLALGLGGKDLVAKKLKELEK
ncbi:MAG: hypothetical protein GXN92_02445 [Candidatus Micrarchaeota archaeon]|nr:hypothetical protein [Candidatus Micrarchaeota archaeon]